MTKKLVCFLALIIAIGAVNVFAQEKPAEGSVTLSKKTWQLSQGVAYETTVDGEERIIVMLSNQPITVRAVIGANTFVLYNKIRVGKLV